jgi:hypothetical protein
VGEGEAAAITGDAADAATVAVAAAAVVLVPRRARTGVGGVAAAALLVARAPTARPPPRVPPRAGDASTSAVAPAVAPMPRLFVEGDEGTANACTGAATVAEPTDEAAEDLWFAMPPGTETGIPLIISAPVGWLLLLVLLLKFGGGCVSTLANAGVSVPGGQGTDTAITTPGCARRPLAKGRG